MQHGKAARRVVGAAVALWLSGSAALGCSGMFERAGQASMGIMPGVVNDPANRSLRRAILRFGLEQFCNELTHRGAPLRMRDEEPVMGRFFARTCNYQELPSGDVFVQFAGVGYAWTNLTLRVGFEASGSIQYSQDFLMHGSVMYTYLRTKNVASTSVNTLMVERAGANGAAALSNLTNPVAQQIAQTQLTRGFTVIRSPDGTVDFGLGLIEKGQRPPKPFQVQGSDRMTLLNERTEVHGQQLDFVGPLAVDSDDRALYLTASIDGVPAIDAWVVSKDVGDRWLEQYIRNPGVGTPPAAPLTSDVVPIRMQWQKAVPLAEGHYYLVLDNSSSIGTVAPPSTGSLLTGVLPASDVAALVNMMVQLGDAP